VNILIGYFLVRELARSRFESRYSRKDLAGVPICRAEKDSTRPSQQLSRGPRVIENARKVVHDGLDAIRIQLVHYALEGGAAELRGPRYSRPGRL
jgi:hypothetical protein